VHPDLLAALDDISASTGPLSDARMAWHPPGKWSAAGILEHLMKGFAGTTHIMRRALDQDRPKARPDTFRERLSAFVVVTVGYFPSGRRAPDMTRPAGMPPAEAREQVRRALADLDEAAALCETRFGDRTKVANHPILGALDVRQWRRFHRLHTRHHMKQIARMKSVMP
jgi:AcrR family transcriptional regulator